MAKAALKVLPQHIEDIARNGDRSPQRVEDLLQVLKMLTLSVEGVTQIW